MLDRNNTLLVIVDLQQGLLPSIHQYESLLKQSVQLITGALLLDIPIIVTEQYPTRLGITDSSVIETLGKSYQPVVKTTMSIMGEHAFQSALSATGRGQILLCGIEAHVCVYQSAADLRADGHEVHLICDCVSSRKESDKDIALKQMNQLGCCLSTAEMAVFELLKVSGTPEFKEWIKIIR